MEVIPEISLCSEYLGAMETMPGKQLPIKLHQTYLPHGTKHLPAGHFPEPLLHAEYLSPCAYGAGGNQDQANTRLLQSGNLVNKMADVGNVESTVGPGEHIGADFDYEAFVHEGKSREKSRALRAGCRSVATFLVAEVAYAPVAERLRRVAATALASLVIGD
jgi:hypothetical protein